MVIYIDESGDPGFKINRGSSRYFVLSCVIFKDESAILQTTQDIIEYKRLLKISNNYEFKFNKLNKEERIGLLRKVNKEKFTIISLLVNKGSFKRTSNQPRVWLNYNYFLELLLGRVVSKDQVYDVRVDGSMGKAHRNALKSQLRKFLPPKALFKLHILDSKNDTLIQFADIISGSIHKSLTDDMDKNIYRDIIKKHIQEEIPV